MPDVYGNIAYFNKICLANQPLSSGGGTGTNLAYEATAQPGANQALLINNWLTVGFPGRDHITLPYAKCWLLAASATIQNTSSNPNVIFAELVNFGMNNSFIGCKITIPANSFMPFQLLQLEFDMPNNQDIYLRIWANQSGFVIGDDYLPTPNSDWLHCGPLIVAIRIAES